MPNLSYTDPHLETLAQRLCETLQQSQRPFETTSIWVPHQGMASWLKHTLSTELGVAAQLHFSLPRTALWQMAQQLFPKKRLKLTRVELLLTLQSHLRSWLDSHPQLGIFQRYVQDSPHRLPGLIQACLQVFDDYATYRPEWLRNFSTMPPGTLTRPDNLSDVHDDIWLAQHTLWWLLEQHVDPEQQRWHAAQLQAETLQKLAQPLAVLPPRWPGQQGIPLHLFALTEEAPFYETMLEQLSRHLTIAHYTHDTHALSATGSFGAPFWYPEDPPEISAPENTGSATRAGVQIQVHGCHHAQREVEVLRDLIQQRETPAEQVGVIVWDLEHYRPLIHGVFRQLPYRIYTPVEDSPVLEVFQSLLQFYQGRLRRSDVLAFIENPWIAQAFGFNAFSAEELRHPLDEVQIRWGRNAFHRQQLGLPAFGQNSWEAGLQRLLMSYALPEDLHTPYYSAKGPRLPVGQEMPRLDILRAFLRFFNACQLHLTPLFQSHTLSDWQKLFFELVHTFLAAVPSEGLLPLREGIARLSTVVPESALHNPLSLGEVQALLNLCWTHSDLPRLHHGHILFGPPEQMAGIPYKDLYLLGLNLGAVPQKHATQDINLRLQSPPIPQELRAHTLDFRRFLRCVQGAQEHLVLMYQSHHMRHQKEVPPAGIVEALIHHHNLTVTHHALQAFDARYFTKNSGYISYNSLYYTCAQELLAHADREPPPPFRSVPLREVPELEQPLTLQRVQHFFRHPARAFLKHGLGLRYASIPEESEEHERFGLDALERYALQQEMLTVYLQSQGNLKAFRQRMHLSERLPVGEAGQWVLNTYIEALSPFYSTLETLFETPGFQAHHSLALKDNTLQAQVLCYVQAPGLEPSEALHLQLSAGRFKATRAIALWLAHLFWQSIEQPEYRIKGIALAKHPTEANYSMFGFKDLSPAEAQHHLQTWITVYHEGQREVLPFAPETSRVLAQALAKSPDAYTAENEARKVWEPSRGGNPVPSESEDPSLAHCLEEDWFTHPEAQELAQKLWDPLESALVHKPLSPLKAQPFDL